ATTGARVWFRCRGQADLDDVGLAPAATSFMGNKGLKADGRGRIPYWNEEKDDTLLPGRRAGQFRPDQESYTRRKVQCTREFVRRLVCDFFSKLSLGGLDGAIRVVRLGAVRRVRHCADPGMFDR